MRFSLLVLCVGTALTVVSSASQANHDSPAPVWVAAHGKTVGTPFGSPGTQVLMKTSSGVVLAQLDYANVTTGYNIFYGQNVLEFLTSDCTGTPYIPSAEQRPYSAGNIQFALTAIGSDLYSWDASLGTSLIQQGSSIPSLLGCQQGGGTLNAVEVTLVQADFLDPFTMPLHLEVTGWFAYLPTGPWWLTVALLGTGFALQWRYFRKKEAR